MSHIQSIHPKSDDFRVLAVRLLHGLVALALLAPDLGSLGAPANAAGSVPPAAAPPVASSGAGETYLRPAIVRAQPRIGVRPGLTPDLTPDPSPGGRGGQASAPLLFVENAGRCLFLKPVH